MKRSGHIPFGQWRLGALVFTGLLIFSWASIRGGSSFFEDRQELVAEFQNVSGLTAGSPVWFRGVEIGSVSKMAIESSEDTSFVAVHIKVRREIFESLNSDASVKIASINIFGEKFVDLLPGTHGFGPLDPDQILSSEALSEIGDFIEMGEDVVGRLEVLIGNLAVMSEKINRGEGSLGLLVNSRAMHDDMRTMMQEVSSLASSLDESQKKTSAALVATVSHLDTLMITMNQNQGTLGLLMNDPKLYNSLAGAAASLDTTMGRVAAGEGTVGKLTKDERAYEEFAKTLNRLNVLLEDIRVNPGKYFKFSVF